MMNDIQAELLAMYKSIAEILDRHGIVHYVNYGTAIGTLRHKGFIPWDDDIDINVFEEDMPEIERVLKEELPPSKYIYEEALSDTHPHVFLYSDSYESDLKNKNALFIDIFPIMRYPEGKIRKIMSAGFVWGIHISVWLLEKINTLPIYRSLLWVPRAFRKLASMMVETDSENTVVYTTEFMNEIFKRGTYEPRIYCDFEDTKVPLPAEIDMMLHVMFGNYMELPPEDQRHGAKGFPMSAYKDYLIRRGKH